MKKLVSVFLCVMLAMQLCILPVDAVSAGSISTVDLFVRYPMCLENAKMREGISSADDKCQAVINSYGKSNLFVSAVMTALDQGIEFRISEELAKCGFGESYYEKIQNKAIRAFLKDYIAQGYTVEGADEKIKKGYKIIKGVVETAQNYNNVIAVDAIVEACKEYFDVMEFEIPRKDIGKMVKAINDSSKLNIALKFTKDAADKALDVWEYTLETIQLYSYDRLIVEDLMHELEQGGQEKFELYCGLKEIQRRLAQNPEEYILEYYGSKTVVSKLAKEVDKLLYCAVEDSTAALIHTAYKVIANYVYQDAKSDDLIQATMQLDYGRSLQICLNEYERRFMCGEADIDDINTFRKLYEASLSAYMTALDFSRKTCKLKDTYTLGGDCMMAKTQLQDTYTYDNYIEWCKEVAAEYASNAGTPKQTVPQESTPAQDGSTEYAPIISLTGETYPGTIMQGENFGIRGTVSCNYGVIAEVYGAILDESGNAVQSCRYYPEQPSDDLRYSINNDLVFGVLNPGVYVYFVSVAARNGEQQTVTTIINSGFQVADVQTVTPGEPESTESYQKPYLTLSDETLPQDIKQGSNFGIRGIVSTDCGVITEVYGEILNVHGEVAQSSIHYPNAPSDNLRYSINNDLIFDQLTAGDYTYRVVATAQNGSEITSATLINCAFSVISQDNVFVDVEGGTTIHFD